MVRLSGRSPRLHILMVSSEASPWAKSGGLGDVVGALPGALETLGHSVTVVLPRYRGVSTGDGERRQLHLPGMHLQVTCFVLSLSERRRIVFVDVPPYFDRAGYYGESGRDYGDNALRFDTLARAALQFAAEDTSSAPPDVVHAHDWQSGSALLRLRLGQQAPSRLASAGLVLTIHNLAYQGVFPKEQVPALGLPWDAFSVDRGEFWGNFSFLKAGITSADYVTTVSPTYARETLTPEHGVGLEGVLRKLGSRYVGILNGIDVDIWNPATDRLLPAHFDATHLEGKAECKRALLAAFGLPRGDDALSRPLVGMVSRLVGQKGLDTIEEASRELVDLDASWVFLGTGEAKYERFLKQFAASHPTRVAAHIGFDERLAHLIEAGSDMFLMPSAFEPCGLNQMYSLRYGTVPIVRAVGGLDDTIQPYTARARNANGFKFSEGSGHVLAQVARRATRLYHNKVVWRRLMLNGMAGDHSWATPAREYVKVYRRARVQGAGRAGEIDGG